MWKVLVVVAMLTACGSTPTDRSTPRVARANVQRVAKREPVRRPASPSVYVQTETGWRFAGEILKRGGSDTLELGSASRALTIELREVKHDKTFLDSIELELDGVAIQPVECGRACTRDQRFEVIERGDARMFRFTWREPTARRVTLRASGYYR